MKLGKKIVSLLLVAVMMLTVVGTAFAETVPTDQTISTDKQPNADKKYTITVDSNDNHTYKVYQILTGTLIPGQTILGNPKWGTDAEKTGTEGVEAFITSIKDADDATVNEKVAAELKENAEGQGTLDKNNPVYVEPGYYLIVDETQNVTGGDAYSLNIVAVFNNIKIAPKKGKTESEKKVDDKDDSNLNASNDNSKLVDSADYDFGDDVPYTLTFTLPADYANYKTYAVNFYDDMSAGLSYNGDAKIYYGSGDTEGSDITFAADTSKTSEYDGGTVYKATVANLKTVATLTPGDVITIKYTAKLKGTAVVGNPGNPNKYQVEYSNNPNADGEGDKGTTPWDKNIVFTFKAVFNKFDQNNKPLAGADFTLYKFVEGTGSDTYEGRKGTWTDVTTLNGGDNHPTKNKEDVTVKGAEGAEDTTVAGAKFTFSGLDAGVYKLSETTTPDGYNKIEDKIFTITAEHDLHKDEPGLTSLNATGTGITFNVDTPNGTVETGIVNNQGSELPSTGGMGTTLLYVGGGILVLAAAILLVFKKRLSTEK